MSFSENPKVYEQNSWTQAAPVKEQKFHRLVSDSIGNNYSPTAQILTTTYIYENTRYSTTLHIISTFSSTWSFDNP